MAITVTKEDIYKELDLIQSCITRMASNSFAMKGWHIGITSALLVFFFSKESVNLNMILLIIATVTLAFWYLDSYYLMVERKYRWKYAWVIKNRVNTDTPKKEYLFDLNPDKEEMWEVDVTSRGYKTAKKTRKAVKNKQEGLIVNLCLLREIKNVMFSNTMEMQYFVVFLASILYFLYNIIKSLCNCY